MKPKPILVATDFILFGNDNKGEVFVLLIQRKNPPFQEDWALPGGFLDPGEELISGALREMSEETSVVLSTAVQIGIYDDPTRDPRGRVISVAYAASVCLEQVHPQPADDAKHLEWHPLKNLPALAFDHEQIIADAVHIVLK